MKQRELSRARAAAQGHRKAGDKIHGLKIVDFLGEAEARIGHAFHIQLAGPVRAVKPAPKAPGMSEGGVGQVLPAQPVIGCRKLDLARVGGKYDNLWHYLHLMDPRSTSPASNMPTYAHFKSAKVDPAVTVGRMRALVKLGVPYTDEDLALAEQRFQSQGQLIADDLAAKDVTLAPDSRMAAVIAYLQRLGRGPQPVVPALPDPAAAAAPAAGGQ